MARTTDIDALNSLLRGEISATETYTQAIEKFAGTDDELNLRRIRDEHTEACDMIREHVRHFGGEPSHGSGFWGGWAKFVEGTSQLFGKAAALKALKEGEEHGINSYRNALEEKTLAPECVSMIRNQLLPQSQAHVPVLDRMIDSQK